MTGYAVVGSAPETERVARGLGLPSGPGVPGQPLIVVARSGHDLAAIRAATQRGSPEIACVVAVSLPEEHVVAAYDLGLPVAFGFCAAADVEVAIEAAPDAAARAVAAALAAVERAIGAR